MNLDDALFRTQPEDAVLDDDGMYALPSGVAVSVLPLVDRSFGGLFARLSQYDATEACRLLGGRLPTKDEVYEMDRVGLRIPVKTLPPDRLMASLKRCREHDQFVMVELAKARWDGRTVVSNAGKLRILVPGMNVGIDEAICGWFDDEGVPVQEGLGPIRFHRGGGRHRTDYGTTVHLIV